MEGLGRRGCGKGAALWGLGKTAIWLPKCGVTQVLETFAKLGFCRLPVKPQELKLRKTYDLEGFWRPVCVGAAHPVGLR